MNKKTLFIGTMLCICSLFYVNKAYTLTLGEIRTEVRFHIKDSNTSRQNYTDNQINNPINQVHRDVVNLSWVIRKSTDFVLVQNTTHYALPTDLIQISRVTFKDGNLEEKSIAGLDGEFSDSDWETAGGYPQDYYQNPSIPGYVSFYPWPNSASSTGTVKLHYFAQANTLSNDSDEPFNSDDRFQQYSDILIWGTVYQIYLIENRQDKAQFYLNAYESRLALMIDAIGRKPNWLPSFSGQRK